MRREVTMRVDGGGMIWVRLTSILFTGLLMSLAAATAVARIDTRDWVNGSVRTSVKGDTLVVKYDFGILECSCDSAALLLPLSGGHQNDTISAIAVKLDTLSMPSKSAYHSCYWKGEALLPGYGNTPASWYRITVYGNKTPWPTTRKEFVSDRYRIYPDRTFRATTTIGMSFSSRSGFPPPVNASSTATALHFDNRMGYTGRKFSMFVGYTINHSKRFSLYDYGRIDLEITPWGGKMWQPGLHGATSYTRVKGYANSIEMVKKGLGTEIGVQLDGPFESLRYNYSSAVGGYHRIDAFFAMIAWPGRGRIGTMYSYYTGKYVRMVGITMCMEATARNSMQYQNRRPFIHKVLAWAVIIPLLPIGWASQG